MVYETNSANVTPNLLHPFWDMRGNNKILYLVFIYDTNNIYRICFSTVPRETGPLLACYELDLESCRIREVTPIVDKDSLAENDGLEEKPYDQDQGEQSIRYRLGCEQRAR